MTDQGLLDIKRLTPGAVKRHLERDPRLIVPVGTTEQHGPHLPLGCDTLIVERLANDLSRKMQVLCAPTIEYGVNSPTKVPYPGSASVRRKTLHRFLNDLVGSWESGGVDEFIIITAHGQDPHQEALSTLRTRRAAVRSVDIFAAPLDIAEAVAQEPIHGGEVDTSLMLYIDEELVDLGAATDYKPKRRTIKRYQRGVTGAIPASSPGSLGSPTLANVEKGEKIYRVIYERIAERVFRAPLGSGGHR